MESCSGGKIRKPMIWEQMAPSGEDSLATAFYRALYTVVTHRGFRILEQFGYIFAVPHDITSSFLPTRLNKMRPSSIFEYVYNSVSVK